MSKGVNNFIGIGRLGQDPITRYTNAGVAVTSFSIAVSENWKDKNEEKQERTEWINICAFAKLGEICGEYLKKGSLVFIEGSLRTSSWESNGVKKYKTEIIARDMQMLSGRNEGQSQNAAAQPAAQAQAAGPMMADDDFDDDIPFDLHERGWIA